MANLILGLHDREAQVIAVPNSWILDTIALSENPQPTNYTSGFNWIARCNWGYGSTGTLPTPDRYGDYLVSLSTYVRASNNCHRWIVGNEPNLSREWPDGKPIYPANYAKCYGAAQSYIHAIPGHKNDEVLIAASGPWNNELKYPGNPSGDWIQYFIDVINACGNNIDGFSIHAYTHSYSTALVTSEATMSEPFESHHYEFRTYRDYLNAIPTPLRGKPVYITEANGGPHWQAVGLMPAMLKEIDDWNKAGTPKVSSVIFYRYPHYDDFYIEGREDVIKEYKAAAQKGYKVPEIHLPQIEQPNGPTATVAVWDGANIRVGPGLNYKILGAAVTGTKLPITGRSADSSWWQVESEFGKGWISGGVVNVANVRDVPIILVTVPVQQPPSVEKPIGDLWQRSYAFVKKWEGGYQDIYNDRGNWTSGIVGQGELKGTNFGISAASYPNLDIRNLSPQEAEAIFFRDFWQASGASTLPFPACLIVLDTSVLHGVGAAKAWLAEVGPNPYIFVARRLRSYLKADNWEFWGKSWVGRTVDLLEEIGKA